MNKKHGNQGLFNTFGSVNGPGSEQSNYILNFYSKRPEAVPIMTLSNSLPEKSKIKDSDSLEYGSCN